MSAPLPFSLNAALPCCPHAELAASLAAELGAFDEDVAGARAGRAGVRLGLTGRPRRRGARRRAAGAADGGVEDLLIHRVVARGRGHAATVAVVVCEIGRRAGMPVGVVGAGARHFVAHEEVTPWLLDVADGELVDARTVRPGPEWRCAHEICDALLTEAERRCERDGDLTRALRAATLRCAAPVRRAGAGERGYRVAAAARPSELSHVRVGLTCPAATSPRTRASARRSNAASCCRHSS